MRTFRLFVVLLFSLFLLPAAVCLRSEARASEPPRPAPLTATEICNIWHDMAAGIAQMRDRNVPLITALRLADTKVRHGDFPVGAYPLVVRLILDAYTSPRVTAAAFAQRVRKECLIELKTSST